VNLADRKSEYHLCNNVVFAYFAVMALWRIVAEHEHFFEKQTLQFIATDKGYYALSNQKLLESEGLQEIGLPRPLRSLNSPPNPTLMDIREKLHNRRAGIEAIISHIKHEGQMDHSCMKSDRTMLAAFYVSVLELNLRQINAMR
jgi:hypothetical protein